MKNTINTEDDFKNLVNTPNFDLDEDFSSDLLIKMNRLKLKRTSKLKALNSPGVFVVAFIIIINAVSAYFLFFNDKSYKVENKHNIELIKKAYSIQEIHEII